MANEFKIKKGLIVTGASGGTVVDIQGSQGQLFSVTDDLSGSIFAVSDISGVPIFDVNSSGLSTFDGLVSGITPVNAANFVTKAYVDGSGGGTGPFLPLAGGTLTGTLISTENQGSASIYINSSRPSLGFTDTNSFPDPNDIYLIRGTSGAKLVFQFYDDSSSTATETFSIDPQGNSVFQNTLVAKGNITSQTTGGAGLNLRRDDTSISGTNTLGYILFQGDDPTDGTFNNGAAIFGKADGSWSSGAYPGQLLLQTRNTTGGLVTALTLAKDQNATFSTQAFATTATSSGDASSTLTTKGYVDGLITGATIYRGTWQAGISATSTGTTSSSTTLTVSAAILDAAGNTPVLVGAVVTGAGITGTVKVASVTSSTVYELDTAISATATAYIFSPIYGAPDLSGVTQTSGYYYICSEAGSATPNGAGTEPNTWDVGDWVIWNDDVGASGEWQKVDNSSVLSGVGTGQTVALWEGPSSVTDSETLGNSILTQQSDDEISILSTSATTGQLGKLTIYGYDDGDTNVKNLQLNVDNGGDSNIIASGPYLWLDSASYIASKKVHIFQQDIFMYNNNHIRFLDGPGDSWNDVLGVTSADIVQIGAIASFNTNLGEVAIYSNNTEAIRIDVDQNVGIGTASPDSPLEVQFTEATGTAKQMLHIDYNSTNNYGSGYLKISAGGSSQALTFIEQVTSGGNGLFGTYIDTNIINKGLSASAHGNINFVTGSSTSASSIVMTIGGGSQKGNVGIGTTLPGYKLDVAEKIRMVGGLKITPTTSNLYAEDGTLSYYSASNGVYLNGAGANGWLRLNASGVQNDQNSINIYGSAGNYMNFRTANSTRMIINSVGNVGINTTSPVVRLHVQGNNIATRTTTTAQSVLRLVRDVTDAAFPSTKDSAVDFMLSRQQSVNNNLPYTRLDFRLAGTTDSSTPSLDVMSLLYNGNVGIGTTNPQTNLVISNAAGGTGGVNLEIQPISTSVVQSYINRSVSPAVYIKNEQRALTHEWDINLTTKLTLNSTGLIAADNIDASSYSGPGQGLDNLLPLGVYSTTPGTAGVLIKTNIASNNYGFIFGTINLEQFNFTSVQRIQLSATVASNGTVVTKAATSDIAITMKLFHVGGYWHIHLPTASTYVTASAYIYTGAGYQGQAKGFNEVNTITVNPVPSGATSSVDIVADVYVTTGSAGGSGPFLPLSAGSSYPLTGTLYLGNVGSDQKIQFQRTGGNVYSIEHDSAQLYFYNRTTTESPLVIQNDGDVLMNAGNVGIGTTGPSKKLEVNGSFKLGTNAYIEYGGVYPYTITTANTAAVGNLVFSAGLGSAAYESRIDLQGTNTAGVAGITLSTASTARMVVTADGDVGIGTSTPNAKLDIQGTQGQLFSVTDDLSGEIFAVADISGVPIMTVNSSGVSYFDGNVGIGTTNPASTLEIAKNDQTNGATLSITNSFNGSDWSAGDIIGAINFRMDDTSNAEKIRGQIKVFEDSATSSAYPPFNAMSFSTANGSSLIERMRINSSGNVGIGTGSAVYGDLHLQGSQQDIVLTNNAADGAANSTISRIIGQARGYSNNGSAMQSIDFVTNATTWYKGDIVFKTNNTDGTDTSVAATERMRIASNGNVGVGFTSPDLSPLSSMKLSVNGNGYFAGNVGIGVTGPQSKLHIETGSGGTYIPNASHDDVTIEGSGNIGLQLFSPNTTYQYIAFGDPDSVNAGYIRYHHGTNKMVLRTNGGDRLHIDSSGNVGIGPSTTSPAHKLEVRDGTISGEIAKFSAIGATVVIESSTAGNAKLFLKPNTTGSKRGEFRVTDANDYGFLWTADTSTNGTAYMELEASSTGGGDLTVKGDVIAYGSPSDKKYKENIKPIESALDKAMKLQGVTFDWKDSESILEIKKDIGFIAQDVQEVLPELVRENKKGNLSLRYQGITPILLEAIKELKAEIEELKKQIK